MFPCMFHFKGGKGILSGGTIAIMIDWRIALVVWGGFLVLAILTRCVSWAPSGRAHPSPLPLGLSITALLGAVYAAVAGATSIGAAGRARKHRGNLKKHPERNRSPNSAFITRRKGGTANHEDRGNGQRRLGDGPGSGLLENGHDVTLWSYTQEESAVLREKPGKPHAEGVPLPEELKLTWDLAV